MDGRELKRNWNVTRSHLAAARTSMTEPVPASKEGFSLARYEEWLEHNELELAFEELEGLGNENNFGVEFWEALLAAASNMELERHAQCCRIAIARCSPKHTD